MKRPVINPSRYVTEHTPEQVAEAIARLMRDGRERTAEDAARAVQAKVITVSRSLSRMHGMGLLHRDVHHGTKIYRKATQ